MKETKIIVRDNFKSKSEDEKRSIVVNNIVKLCLSQQLIEVRAVESV